MSDLLISRFDRLVAAEQGQSSVALTVMRHLPRISAEDAALIYNHVVTTRVWPGDGSGVASPDSAEDAENVRRDIELFTEGFLCGLRVAALVRGDGG